MFAVSVASTSTEETAAKGSLTREVALQRKRPSRPCPKPPPVMTTCAVPAGRPCSSGKMTVPSSSTPSSARAARVLKAERAAAAARANQGCPAPEGPAPGARGPVRSSVQPVAERPVKR